MKSESGRPSGARSTVNLKDHRGNVRINGRSVNQKPRKQSAYKNPAGIASNSFVNQDAAS